MDTRRIPLEAEHFYHIYNRGVNGQDIFFEERNYAYFLQKYALYVHPMMETYAYCLLGNHFHLLVKIKAEEEIRSFINGKKNDKTVAWHASNAFSSLFQSYAQAINKKYDRTGQLFEEPFHRIKVESDSYFSQLVWYIHYNPQKHGFIKDFKDYPHSSYWSHLQTKPTKLQRERVMEWFGNASAYQEFHSMQQGEKNIKALMIES